MMWNETLNQRHYVAKTRVAKLLSIFIKLIIKQVPKVLYVWDEFSVMFMDVAQLIMKVESNPARFNMDTVRIKN
jgi:hypothetical protein